MARMCWLAQPVVMVSSRFVLISLTYKSVYFLLEIILFLKIFKCLNNFKVLGIIFILI